MSSVTSNGAIEANSTPSAATAVNTTRGRLSAWPLNAGSTPGQITPVTNQPRAAPRAEPVVFVATSIQEETAPPGAKS